MALPSESGYQEPSAGARRFFRFSQAAPGAARPAGRLSVDRRPAILYHDPLGVSGVEAAAHGRNRASGILQAGPFDLHAVHAAHRHHGGTDGCGDLAREGTMGEVNWICTRTAPSTTSMSRIRPRSTRVRLSSAL